ncbi:MAG: 3-oxoadipate enol-lactonase [Gammaproteobacteria bacterium]|jgi:3-oxoadipate enol-lactonase
MPVLKRANADLFYDVCDIVPPWQNKETVLFLNGLAIDSGIWVTWLPALADRYRIVRTDLRGFGRSFVPPAGETWHIEDIAQDVIDVMAATGTERVHFVGESTGGTVGLYLGAQCADKLLSLTTVSAAHRGGAIRNSKDLRDEVETLGMQAWSAKVMDLRFHPGALSNEMYAWFHDVQRNSAPHACMDLVEMLVACDLTARLPDIDVATLILAPDDSPFVTVEAQVERLRAMPNAELAVIANSRHGVSYSHGAECARILRRFIDGL